MDKEVTIYDIAGRLGISPTTVSRALNNHKAVNEQTKQRIFKEAKEMGYRSNIFASNLRSKRTNTIGVIVPRLNSPFQSSAIAGMEKIANESGFNLVISQSLESLEKEIANVQMMFNSRVDGLLVSLVDDPDNIQHFQPFIDGVAELFKYSYGIETGRLSDFESLQVKAELFPYVFMSETEQVANILQLRSAGALSRQTASEMAYELGYGINSEYERITKEERDMLIGTQVVQPGSTNNVVNNARNNKKEE